MDRRITGYHLDAENHWVAELECGHNQHVRHNPPWNMRPWVITPQGRASKLGAVLFCKKCDRNEPPDLQKQHSNIQITSLDKNPD